MEVLKRTFGNNWTEWMQRLSSEARRDELPPSAAYVAYGTLLLGMIYVVVMIGLRMTDRISSSICSSQITIAAFVGLSPFLFIHNAFSDPVKFLGQLAAAFACSMFICTFLQPPIEPRKRAVGSDKSRSEASEQKEQAETNKGGTTVKKTNLTSQALYSKFATGVITSVCVGILHSRYASCDRFGWLLLGATQAMIIASDYCHPSCWTSRVKEETNLGPKTGTQENDNVDVEDDPWASESQTSLVMRATLKFLPMLAYISLASSHCKFNPQ